MMVIYNIENQIYQNLRKEINEKRMRENNTGFIFLEPVILDFHCRGSSVVKIDDPEWKDSDEIYKEFKEMKS